MTALKIIQNDPLLLPYSAALEGRHEYVQTKINELTHGCEITLSDFATGYLYFGLHKIKLSW